MKYPRKLNEHLYYNLIEYLSSYMDTYNGAKYFDLPVLKILFIKYFNKQNVKEYLNKTSKQHAYKYKDSVNILNSISNLLKIDYKYDDQNLLSWSDLSSPIISRNKIIAYRNQYYKKMMLFIANNFEYEFIVQLVRNKQKEYPKISISNFTSIYGTLIQIQHYIDNLNSEYRNKTKIYQNIIKQNEDLYSHYQTIKAIFITNVTKISFNSYLGRYLLQYSDKEQTHFDKIIEEFFIHATNICSKFKSLLVNIEKL